MRSDVRDSRAAAALFRLEAPREIARIESGFNPLALSPKGARGIWQLMPGTARRFGLRVDAALDQRTDPALSTRAAALYWESLRRLFAEPDLAAAAYNAGEGRVREAITTGGTRDFETLARRGLLPEETRRYVDRLRAAGVLSPP